MKKGYATRIVKICNEQLETIQRDGGGNLGVYHLYALFKLYLSLLVEGGRVDGK